jgi:hypothetical protein
VSWVKWTVACPSSPETTFTSVPAAKASEAARDVARAA